MTSRGSDQTARMRRLIWGFAGCTYHIVGNLMHWLYLLWKNLTVNKMLNSQMCHVGLNTDFSVTIFRINFIDYKQELSFLHCHMLNTNYENRKKICISYDFCRWFTMKINLCSFKIWWDVKRALLPFKQEYTQSISISEQFDECTLGVTPQCHQQSPTLIG